MKNITITQTIIREASTVKVTKILTTFIGDSRNGIGLTTLVHNGDGENLVITYEQYQLLQKAKELTICAGNIVTNYIQIHD